jgi:hypothetical protein
MLRVGGAYRYRVGSYVHSTKFRVESHNGTHWVARSQDSFEVEIYADDEGRHVGSRELGMYETPISVWFVIEDDIDARSWEDVQARQ